MSQPSGTEMIRAAADYLDEMRQALGLSQEELGRRIGRAQSTVAHALTGERTVPKLDTIVLLALGMAVEVELVVRPVQPIQPAADPSGEVFSCECGFHRAGPAGEIGRATWSREHRKWLVWIPVGPSSYQLEVEHHIRVCKLADARCRVENF
jgi:transcriptional regulator with XRE-family HTH domain